MENHLELLKIDPTYNIYFHDNTKMILTHDDTIRGEGWDTAFSDVEG